MKLQHHRKFTDEQFIQMASESESLSDFMIKLGYANSEGSSRHGVKKRCVELSIPIPLASGKTMTKNACKTRVIPVEEYFAKNTNRTGHTTREKIIRENLLNYKCAFCGNDGNWNGKPLTLELDHINGDHLDNRLKNLRFLCPNCHAQTETFRGRKNKKVNRQ